MEKNKAISGKIVIISFLIATALIWFFVRRGTDMFNDYGTSTHTLGQLTGLIGMVLFSLSFVLTTRLKTIEKMFGGLDKVYSTHHQIGVISFILLLFHPILLVIKFVPEQTNLAAKYLLPSSSWAVNFGIISLLAMTFLIILTLFINMKYQNWKFSHKFLGIVFALAILHIFLVTTDISKYELLRNYMIVVCTFGMFSHIYGSYLRHLIKENYFYTVEFIESKEKITNIALRPKNKRIAFSPGQFIYIKFFDKNIPKEQHPFTVSSSPQDELLRLSIKYIGDYTEKLKDLKINTLTKIEGPYGNFSCDKTKKQIWIAGGIGITPFLSMANSLSKDKDKCESIDLYYCTRNKKEAVFLDELMKISSKIKSLRIINHYSDEEGHITADKIEKISKGLNDKEFYLCGPYKMMDSIVKGLKMKKVNLNKIHREDFSLK